MGLSSSFQDLIWYPLTPYYAQGGPGDSPGLVWFPNSDVADYVRIDNAFLVLNYVWDDANTSASLNLSDGAGDYMVPIMAVCSSAQTAYGDLSYPNKQTAQLSNPFYFKPGDYALWLTCESAVTELSYASATVFASGARSWGS